MKIKKLTLANFRLFTTYSLTVTAPIVLLVGANGAGKSSVIEAMELVSTGKSYRAGKSEEMIKVGADLARVKIQVSAANEAQNLADLNSEQSHEPADDLAGLDEVDLSLMLTPGQVNHRPTARQLYAVNDLKRRKKDFVGQLLTVAFRPEDMRLVEGSPTRRRDYLDRALSLVDSAYAVALSQYEKVWRQRNRLLFNLREQGATNLSSLKYWDLSLIKAGQYLQQQRQVLIKFINQIPAPLPFSVSYQPSIISAERLASHQARELAAGFTLIGPQKDDLVIKINWLVVAQNLPKTIAAKNEEVTGLEGLANLDNNSQNSTDIDDDLKPLATFGSRGQQRLAVLWLKIAELAFLEQQTQTKPVLLLDDILSELDETSQSQVLKLLKSGQSVISSTDAQVADLLTRAKLNYQLVTMADQNN